MFLRVTDIKQYFYCPRIIYFTYCTPVEKKTTAKMDWGSAEHEAISVLERRRKLRRYGLEGGRRQFHVWLHSEKLGLSGILDMLIETAAERVPVEFKMTDRPVSANHRYQLIAQALLMEAVYGELPSRGFIYRVPLGSITAVKVTDALKRRVLIAVDEMHRIIEGEWMPEPARNRAKCTDCEFRNFCAV